MGEASGRALVVVPTYDEASNIAWVVGRVRAAVPAAHILVVDDESPDGTGRIADDLAARDDHVHVLHHVRKEGLGAAYVAGFGWGLQREFDTFVQMDADGSHLPEQIPALVARLAGADVVIGSRWLPGGVVENWPRRREVLSRGGNAFVRLALGVHVHDTTGGFRAWRRSALEAVDLTTVASAGYCFQVDLTRRALAGGLRVVEVPIRFVERARGESKMSGAIVREALWRVTAWGLGDRLRQIGSWRRRRRVRTADEPGKV